MTQRYKDLMINDKYSLRFWQMDSNSGNFVCSIDEEMLDEAIKAGASDKKPFDWDKWNKSCIDHLKHLGMWKD